MFNPMFAIFALILSSPLAQAAQLDLLCKEGRNPSFRLLSTLYEKISVTTPTGPRTVYVASQLFFVRSFVPATVVAGDKGQNLAVGECGLAAAILQGVPTGPLPMNLPAITFRDFLLYESGVSSVDASSSVTSTNLNARAVLPFCSTNVYRFIAQQASNPQFFDVIGDAAVTCVAP
jgi:hypothetical protein